MRTVCCCDLSAVDFRLEHGDGGDERVERDRLGEEGLEAGGADLFDLGRFGVAAEDDDRQRRSTLAKGDEERERVLTVGEREVRHDEVGLELLEERESLSEVEGDGGVRTRLAEHERGELARVLLVVHEEHTHPFEPSAERARPRSVGISGRGCRRALLGVVAHAGEVAPGRLSRKRKRTAFWSERGTSAPEYSPTVADSRSGMRIRLTLFAALACSGLAANALADPDDETTADVGVAADDTCPKGALGSVDGVVTRFVSDGSRVFFVAQRARGAPRVGVLGPDGTRSTLSEDPNVSSEPLAAVEGGVASAVAGNEIRFWNAAGSPSAVDVAASNGLVAAVTADANGLLHWYEYDRRYGVLFEAWNGSSVVSRRAPSNFEGGSFATDGQSYFGAFTSWDGRHSIGKLAVGSDSEVTFATVHRPSAAFAFVCMDANRVYYVLQTDDGIVRFAGSDKTTGATVDYGAQLGIDGTRPLVVREGYAYVADGTAQDPAALVTRYDLATGAHVTIVAGPSADGAAITLPLVADACGIVYAMPSTANGDAMTDLTRIAP